VMLRADSDPDSLASALRNAVAQMDPELPLDGVMSMPALIERQRRGNPLLMRLLATFDFLALLLAGIGIYGLIAYSVSQRTREIGIRIALGAHARDVLGMVLWQGMKMTAAGTVIGLAMAAPLPKVFDSMFFPLHFREPRIYFVVPIVILVVAALATYIPARRASGVDPMSALRQE
jgi:putative ABC transport system permease protein